MDKTLEPVSRLRVILAEDNAMMREKVIMLLEPEFEVVGAVSDGAALIEAALDLDPDIAVVDISMPRMSGIEAVRKLKSNGSRMLVVFLTVYDDSDFVRAAFDSGASAYVVKSRMVTDLLTAVRGAINGQAFISPGLVLNETEAAGRVKE